ncbi:diaminopimelate decarboxylase [Methylophilales bacterium MBRSG12]|uniref:Diaminopimelate decarboxylase n=1 Tax=Methylophilales bacterium MBRS-H7 TaxID=1623450 RepID=A0A0H4J2C3_9PROT|nr:diaminopimelate decarboxylase [Methylophilales bacterium MBRSF5]AKO65888.1 diaminopimelate decarboxylase [Methylophilales bacterium MBRS-H7]AKO67208.1 diaminopimelate decarboxylase [Methylophilales bacterium MBRSG12]
MNKSLLRKESSHYFIEDVKLTDIAQKFGTPAYVYSKKHILDQINFLQNALSDIDHLICFAVKANSNLSILKLFKECGCGFDIVSGGELQRVLTVDSLNSKIVFSGVGKSFSEIEMALNNNILAFNVESEEELFRINNISQRLSKIAKVSIRVNPNVDAKTHPYISTGLKDNKFGIDETSAIKLYKKAAKLDHIKITGIDCHIGSQLTDLSPFEDAFIKLASLIDELESNQIAVEHIDIGGGIGISYNNEDISPIDFYVQMIKKYLLKYNKKIILEPGRFLIGKAGLMLTNVEYIKKSEHKNFVLVDAAMNDLMRPSLYNAFHEVINLSDTQDSNDIFDIVGPICETGDFLAKDRNIKANQGDILAIMDAGAYGFSMSSNYNSRPRIPEIIVDKDEFYLIRERENFCDLIAHEEKFLK